MASPLPDFADFRRAAASADLVPVFRTLLADRLTPVTAFERLATDDAPAFLLESVVGGERIGRYSFIATDPVATYVAKDGRAVRTHADGSVHPFDTADPLADLQSMLGRRRFARDPRLPGFTGGLVGYAGYDLIRYYESDRLGTSAPPDDRRLPDVAFGLYRELVLFDHVDKTVRVVANADAQVHPLDEAYADAAERLERLVRRLSTPAAGETVDEVTPGEPPEVAFEQNLDRDAYESAVARGTEYIRAGDIFQFVPSRRLRVRHAPACPFDVYRSLRVLNPSPFMFYLKTAASESLGTAGCTLIGSSPEILCRVQNGLVESRPLAGTRRRGRTPEEDAAMEADLLADPKERAEHVMLVDLHRNDVGRVSEPGSVTLSDLLTVERYSHVMHLSSHVTGRLMPGLTAFDALRVSLPVGTVSGAPKLRAMQIIDECEPTRRGPYGGAVGYVGFDGDLDTCIALRTIVHTDRGYDVQSGGGVVADSTPAAEYEESMNKARVLLKAIADASARAPRSVGGSGARPCGPPAPP